MSKFLVSRGFTDAAVPSASTSFSIMPPQAVNQNTQPATPVASSSTPVVASPVNGATLTTNVIDVYGTGEPGASIRITFDKTNTTTDVFKIDSNGRFRGQVTLDQGNHTLCVTQWGSNGQPTNSNVVTFVVQGK